MATFSMAWTLRLTRVLSAILRASTRHSFFVYLQVTPDYRPVHQARARKSAQSRSDALSGQNPSAPTSFAARYVRASHSGNRTDA
jgi:hypothetical protein